MNIQFKFELGDFVMHKTEIGRHGTPHKMLIEERLALECGAGIQITYVCSSSLMGQIQRININENTLEKYQEKTN